MEVLREPTVRVEGHEGPEPYATLSFGIEVPDGAQVDGEEREQLGQYMEKRLPFVRVELVREEMGAGLAANIESRNAKSSATEREIASPSTQTPRKEAEPAKTSGRD